jgi:hypothetical protein
MGGHHHHQVQLLRRPPLRLRDYTPALVCYVSRLFMFCVSWCDPACPRDKVVRKVFELVDCKDVKVAARSSSGREDSLRQQSTSTSTSVLAACHCRGVAHRDVRSEAEPLVPVSASTVGWREVGVDRRRAGSRRAPSL